MEGYQNPYFIWLSEIILQQTRVLQGLPYFNAFVENYPTVESLANANEQDVLRLWQGLGYYSRARNLHFTAKHIVEKLNSKFPNNYKDLLQLKGIGEYTAAAIASFSYNESVPVVDGNVLRLISRLFLIETPVDENSTKKIIKNILEENIKHFNPSDFNQSIMEFGALQCKPEPECATCPLIQYCLAYKHKKNNELPIKNKKVKQKTRYFYYLIPLFDYSNSLSTLIKKRTEKDIWLNLFDFYTIESSKIIEIKDIEKNKNFKSIAKNEYEVIKISENVIHQLTHQKLICSFIIFKINTIDEKYKGDITSIDEIENLPKPIIIEKYLKTIFYPLISKYNI